MLIKLKYPTSFIKGRFMNRVANMNPERRLKKLLSDRYANMSEERRAKKKEVKIL